MPRRALSPDQQAEAERIFQALRRRSDDELRELAEILASSADSELLRSTELEMRDHVHRFGAQAVALALEERKKRGTKGRASRVRIAPRRPSSSAGRPKRS